MKQSFIYITTTIFTITTVTAGANEEVVPKKGLLIAYPACIIL